VKPSVPLVLAILLSAPVAARASDDCTRPMVDWQSREAVSTHVAQLGITMHRLRIDDGCYEIRGRDADGNAVELKIDPATFGLMELEIRFRRDADPSRYLPGAKRRISQSTTATPHGARTAERGDIDRKPHSRIDG
jgi:hypothetical protein